jgi:hypothetical protein
MFELRAIYTEIYNTNQNVGKQKKLPNRAEHKPNYPKNKIMAFFVIFG